MTKTFSNCASSSQRPDGTCLKIPKTNAEFSSNWKSILSVVKESDREKKSVRPLLHGEKSTKKIKKQKFKLKKESAAECSSGAARKKANEPCSSKIESTTDNISASITKCLAIDCEFVGVGQEGKDDMLARVSIVNLHGDCVYDKHVAPVEEVIDYRTAISGIRPENLVNAEKLKVVQKEVGELIQGHILVGHNVKKDLQMLFISHPKKDLRDTSKYRPFRVAARTKWPSLKKLASIILGLAIQTGEHDSVTDAKVTMQLYRTQRKAWESGVNSRRKKLIMKTSTG